MLLYETARVLEDKLWKMSFNSIWLSFLLFPLLGLFVWAVDPSAFYAFFLQRKTETYSSFFPVVIPKALSLR